MEKANDNLDRYWKNEYPNLSREEKIKFWSGNLHRQMRWNGESGIDELEVFSSQDYTEWKSKDSNFDNLFPDIVKMLNLDLHKISRLIHDIE